MAEKSYKALQTRISLKIDTWANWADVSQAGKGGNLVLKRGEVAFVQVDNSMPPIDHTETGTTLIENPNTVLYKVGDDKTPFKDLKWGGAIAADVYAWAKAKKASYDATNKKIVFLDSADKEIAGTAIDLSSVVGGGDLTKAVNELKGTKAAGDTTAETIRGAKDYADAKIAALVDGAPEALNTLDELAAALKDNKDIVDVLNEAIAAKASTSDLTQHTGNQSNPHKVTAAQVGAYTKEAADLAFAAKSHETNTNVHVTTDDKTKWNAVTSKADASVLTQHTGNQANPHKVTAAQVNAYTKEEADDNFAPISHVGDATHVTESEKTDWNKVTSKLDASLFTQHTSASNPHGITPGGIGAYTTGEADEKFAAKSHESDTTKHITAAERTKWDAVTSKADTSTVTGITNRVKAIEDKYMLAENQFLWIDGGTSTDVID